MDSNLSESFPSLAARERARVRERFKSPHPSFSQREKEQRVTETLIIHE